MGVERERKEDRSGRGVGWWEGDGGRDLLEYAGQDERLVGVRVDGIEVGQAHQVRPHQDAQVQALLPGPARARARERERERESEMCDTRKNYSC